jgi:hypothetical protein
MMKTAAAEVCLDKPESPRFAVGEFLNTVWRALAQRRCQFLHDQISRPVNGKYRCWTCQREFDTDW